MQRAASGRPVAGALGKPEDRLLILVGHDTNLSNVSGALGLTWLIDGRLDDTPPGGALMFELWQDRQTGEYSVRTSYTTQTIEQMRSVASLSTQNPPERVPVFVPGCSQADDSCRWNAFQQAIHAGTEAEFER